MPETQEKKVEYLELIYDLIFVYLIGRNNSMLHSIEDGFIPGMTFYAYVLCTLSIIQIWNFSTFYINLYGRNSVRDHAFLFINMYLFYHMADGMTSMWQPAFYHFCTAWALILVNLGLQHLIEMRNHADEPHVLALLRRKAIIILTEAGLILLHMLGYYLTGISFSIIPILFGFIANIMSGKVSRLVPVDFPHLSERAMLYVVFTFGEMVISITDYFSGPLTSQSAYFSTMAFLIVAGLFLSYELLYNRMIDRDMTTNGTGYMLIHVFLVFALNNISVALEFMRMENVDLLPKTLFISASFLLYSACLFALGFYTKNKCGFNFRLFSRLAVLFVIFFTLMVCLRHNMYINIAISVAFVAGVFLVLFRRSRDLPQQCS